jgi:hypothetical protein
MLDAPKGCWFGFCRFQNRCCLLQYREFAGNTESSGLSAALELAQLGLVGYEGIEA